MSALVQRASTTEVLSIIPKDQPRRVGVPSLNTEKLGGFPKSIASASKPSLTEAQIVQRDQIIQNVIIHTTFPAFVTPRQRQILEDKLHVFLKKTAEREVRGEIPAGATQKLYQRAVIERASVLDPNNPDNFVDFIAAGQPPSNASVSKTDRFWIAVETQARSLAPSKGEWLEGQGNVFQKRKYLKSGNSVTNFFAGEKDGVPYYGLVVYDRNGRPIERYNPLARTVEKYDQVTGGWKVNWHATNVVRNGGIKGLADDKASQHTMLTPDPRGEGYEPIELQIANEAILAINWHETENSHTADYGMSIEARKALLGYALAVIGVNSPKDLPEGWYQNKPLLEVLSAAAGKALLDAAPVFDSEGNATGPSPILDAAEYFLKMNIDYPDEDTLPVKGQENIPVSQYTDIQKIRALRYFAAQPLQMEANQRRETPLQALFDVLMVLDGAGMVFDFFERIGERAVTSSLSEEIISEEAENSILPGVTGGELEAENSLAVDGLDAIGKTPEGQPIYAAMNSEGEIVYFRQVRGRLFQVVDEEGNNLGSKFLLRTSDGEFLPKVDIIGGVIEEGTAEEAATAIDSEILNSPQKTTFLQFTRQERYAEGLKFALESMGMEYDPEIFQVVDSGEEGAAAVTKKWRGVLDHRPVIQIPKSTLQRLANDPNGLAELRALLVHELKHYEFFLSGVSDAVGKSENEVLAYYETINKVKIDIENGFEHIPTIKQLFDELTLFDNYFQKMPPAVRELHSDLYKTVVSLYKEGGAYYNYFIEAGGSASEYLDSFMHRAKTVFTTFLRDRTPETSGLIEAIFRIYDDIIPGAAKTEESDMLIQSFRELYGDYPASPNSAFLQTQKQKRER
ncbi:30S ribosomal protein S16 [Roseibium sp. TrichSKD4]|uniref:30S ribosomal protein S16 n=1 Tax=Roseibium sp. TrichSKD4 TaxID=744980 RepID=UPI00143A07D2|nr:30S ribosomal protein S16 [Roseibium sp. TrichSKD4]